MSHLSSHPNYRFLKWVSYWRVFNFIHARAFFWPWVPILIASAFMIKAVNDTSLSDFLLYFGFVMFLGEQPLLIALSRRAYHQTISEIGISTVDIHHVKEGLKLAQFNVTITDEMEYGEFIICDLIGQLARK